MGLAQYRNFGEGLPDPALSEKKLLIEPGLPWVLHSTEILVRGSALSEQLTHTLSGVTGSGHINLFKVSSLEDELRFLTN